MTSTPVLTLEAAHGVGDNLPWAPLDLVLVDGDFALIETPGSRRGTAFADLCAGLAPLSAGCARFLGRDWAVTPGPQADALRGQIGRLFYRPMRADTPDVAARILLARLHHTRIPEAALREEAAALGQRFGLPGLPAGPARLLSDTDLMRAGCVRAFLGQPRLVILELSAAMQEDELAAPLLAASTAARGHGASVIWLAGAGPALRDRILRPTHRLRLSDAGLAPVRQWGRAV
jgi:phospholipid/cholesterol/gamma-HCH transport system ATP-binding protein